MNEARQEAGPAGRVEHHATPKTVLITGGSRGIGKAICLEFGRAGWRVGVHYRERREDAERTVAEIAGYGAEGIVVQADVRDGGQVAQMVRTLLDRWPQLDVLVCNAGQASNRLLLKMSMAEWQETIDTNLTGTFHCLRAVGAPMITRGRGSIVVVGSFAGIQGQHGQAAYAASKSGLLGLVRTAAREWGSQNVTVNAVFPGWHQTELSGESMPAPSALEDHVLARTPDLQEVARSVYHLAQLRDVSGQVWNLDSRII